MPSDAPRKKPKEKQHDIFFSRALLMLQRLSVEQNIALKELAEAFNVTERTIKRDLERLHFFPISYKQGVVSVDEGFSIEHTRLTNDELLYMELAFSAVEEVSEDVRQKFHAIRAKLSTPLFATPYEVKGESFESIDMDSVLLNKIEDAINCRNIAIVSSYDMQSHVEPYKVVAFDGIWYLFAKDIEANKIKTYLIASITEFRATTQQHSSDMKSIEKMLDSVHTAWFEDGHTFMVKVKIRPPAAAYFKLKKYFPSQYIIKEPDDGSLIVTFEVSSDEDIDNLIKAWLPHIEVISPERFRKRISRELEDYLSSLRSYTLDR